MKSEVILEAIGKANDKYIEEAAPREKKFKTYKWIQWCAAAACLILAVYAGFRFLPKETVESGGTVSQSDGESLPMLTIPSNQTDGEGFEGLMAFDSSELGDGNPWTVDTQLDTMPVYKNTAYDSTGTAASGIGKERMLELAEQAADALNMKISDVEYDTNGSVRLVAETDTAKIEVLGWGTVTVSFQESIKLPEEYGFTYVNPSDEEAGNATDYLIKKFNAFLSFKKPQKALFADYTFDGNRNRSYYVYDASGDIMEQILNYNFNKGEFAPDDNGNLMLIRKDNILFSAEKIGDYPMITSEEALKLMLNGNYITTVPEKMPGKEYVAKTELVYKTSSANETYLPYYRFLVELPDMRQENGLKTYGAYYVPAVQRKYLTNMPLWDGSFN